MGRKKRLALQNSFGGFSQKVGNNVYTGLDRVSSPDLHKLDFLHNIYLRLFKHMMEWVEGFLKKHKRHQGVDDAGKEIAPYPGFSPPKKPYSELKQGQGKVMRNLAHCIAAVLGSGLRNLASSQYREFKSALQCVSALVKFT